MKSSVNLNKTLNIITQAHQFAVYLFSVRIVQYSI